ncbi:FAD-dependent thymidylate synthase [Feifania hominis]|uniref:Flavin-dependent thymidylate synthase n=1 Tax=Feifania hominis TaxID=2763660 RepID=A0A926DBW2_9FIRM|nr:FAD-dependent thymidylate synthase [Feifania hominis]MBC8535243.1 FAD-dependent thymidylate synthase [Feifania hominis]
MKVTLLAHTPDPERTVAAAAKLCYASGDIETVMEGLTDEKTESFLEMLAQIGHESPIEHVSFTFGIEGVSRALLAQITRHRIASFSVQSQRYVREGSFDYVVPPAIAENPEAMAVFTQAMRAAQESYDELVRILSDQRTQELIAGGKPEKEAARAGGKLANEDARFVLPNACDTKMIVTMNARSLMNFFHHRCCNRAQWEIRELATEMLREVRRVAPTLFAKAGPKCMTGKCPEGKMSCGRMEEMRAKFSAL